MNKLVRTYPYPVLRPESDDFIDAKFTVDCETELLPTDKYSLHFTVINTCPEIQKLIKDGIAVYLIRIVCGTTMYRDTVTFSEEEYTVEISRNVLLNEVSISPMIVSLEDIDNYSCEAFHPDYKESTVSISMGDSLAVAKPICFDAQPQNEIGETPESIIRFMKETDPEAPLVSLGIGDKYIYIKLHEKMLQDVSRLANYYTMQPNDEMLLWSIFVIPTLTQILAKWFSRDFLESNQAEAKGKVWFKVIRDKFESLGVIEVDTETGDIMFDEAEFDELAENAFAYAELLVGDPLITSIATLSKNLDQDNTYDGDE